MAELKTKATDQSVRDFLNQIPNEITRKDCIAICELMEEIAQVPAKMWGTAIIGVGHHVITYASGKKLDWFMMGFSPRKANISLYILGCDAKEKDSMLIRLGKHSTGKGCVYIKNLADINMEVLKEMCIASYNSLNMS